MKQNAKSWYQQSSDAVLEKLKVTKAGLSMDEVLGRQQQYGINELAAAGVSNWLKLLIKQFKDVLIIILLISASISAGLHIYENGNFGTESLLIYSIVVGIALVGFFNEYKAEKTVDSLKSILAFKARVRRSGEVVEIDAKQLVPGDILLIEEGQKIPADARLIKSEGLKMIEASLTGESEAVNKHTKLIKRVSALGDQSNMVFSGTHVASGTGEAVVVAIGQSTQIGEIANLVASVKSEHTPMQRKLDALGKRLGIIVIVLCVLVFIVVLESDQVISGTFLQRMIFAFTTAVALAVAAIPEGLAFVVRISLALGARRMAKKKALVRTLSAVEALGSTDVICTDKTGTLTKGEMTVRSIWTDGEFYELTGEGYQIVGELKTTNGQSQKATNAIDLVAVLGVLCNNAALKTDGIIGDPTEAALLVSGAKLKADHASLQAEYPRLKEFPFNSDRKMMSTVHKDESEYMVCVKGAPDTILQNATKVFHKGKLLPLNESRRQAILAANSQFASGAKRVLALAMKQTKQMPKNAEAAESDLIFVGLQAMIDPPRPEVAKVIGRVEREAGMRVVMITGDHIDTARAIGKELSITGEAISGLGLDDLTQSEFEARVEKISIYARVNPEHKIRIVQALQKNGHQVAMTGDGVNDAPAIKAADIGIAMGITGTDVTKEAADLILLDDQFLTIITAIEEGRGIFDNVRKFVNFLVSCNVAEVVTILAGLIFANKLLLTPAQILFVNIITDGLPAIALGSDPAAKAIMKFSPKKFQSSIINLRTWAEITIFSLIMSATLLLFYHYTPPFYSAAVIFTGMVVFEIARLIDIRTDYKIRWLSNPLLSVALLGSLLLQIAVIYITPLAKLFQVHSMQLIHWVLLLLSSAAMVAIMKSLNRPLAVFGKEHD